VRSRINWKYALGLELTDPGFHYSVLCEFRSRLIVGAAEQLLFETLLKLSQARGWLKERSRQRTDSTHILAAVRKLNRVELVGETLYHALDVLAQIVPDWLKAHSQPDWFERYSQHPTDAGYPSAELLVTSREQYGIDLLGPMRPDVSWQSQDPQAFDITQFQIDWQRQVVICPLGKTSRCWWPAKGPRGKPTLRVHFGEKDCLACASRARCTKSESTPRGLTLQPKEQQLALQAARH
jgi:hypothetical protein